MEQKAAEGLKACSVLGAAYASGCAPEGAAPAGLDAAPRSAKTSQTLNAHVEAILTAITQRFPQTFGRK